MRKLENFACVEVTLLLFPDVIFHLTPNYPDLAKSEYGGGDIHHHFYLGCTIWGRGVDEKITLRML